MDNKFDLEFRLKNIEQFKSSTDLVETITDNESVFKFNINIEHLFNINENLIAVVPKVEICINDSKEVVGSLSASLIFEFTELSKFIVNNEVKLPIDTFTAINSISISTIRGLMFATFKGTALHNAILPLVDPKGFITKK